MSLPWNLLHVLDAVLAPSSNMSTTERIVVVALIRYGGTGGGAIWPSHASLAADTGLSKRSVVAALKALRGRTDLPIRLNWTRGQRSAHYTIELLERRPRSEAAAQQDTPRSEAAAHLKPSRSEAAAQQEEHQNRPDVQLTTPDVQLTTSRSEAAAHKPTQEPTQQNQPSLFVDPPKAKKTKKAKSKPAAPKPHRLPADWSLDPKLKHWAICSPIGATSAEVEAQAEAFRDHWHADASPKSRKLDWHAAFRTWMRNWRKWQPRQHSATPAQPADDTDGFPVSKPPPEGYSGLYAVKPPPAEADLCTEQQVLDLKQAIATAVKGPVGYGNRTN